MRRFILLWSGLLISRIGSGVSVFALGVHIFDQTGSSGSYGLMLFAAFAPSFLLAPVGGAAADRRSRRHVLILSNAASAAGMVLACAGALASLRWLLMTGVVASSLASAFQGPAFKAVLSDLVEPEDYRRASALMQLAEASRFLVAPALAALLMTHLSLAAVLVIDSASFVAAALSAVAVPRRRPDEGAPGPDRRRIGSPFEGMADLASNPGIRRLILAASAATFAAGATQALLGPLVLGMAGPQSLGWVQSVSACGMLGSSILLAGKGGGAGEEKDLYRSLAVMGFFILGIGLSPNAATVAGAGFGLFASLPAINTRLETMLRLRISGDRQGRLWGTLSLVTQVAMLIGLVSAGFITEGVIEPMVGSGGPPGYALPSNRLQGESMGLAFFGGLLLIFTVSLRSTSRFRSAAWK